MASLKSLYIIDWRQYGDFSAVGQLTKKIFSQLPNEYNVFQLKTNWNSLKLTFLSINNNVERIVKWDIFPDAALQEVKANNGEKVFYLRLSPNIAALELSIKLRVSNPDAALIVHYMDKPDLSEFSASKKHYVEVMYRYLIKNSNIFLTINSTSVDALKLNYGRTPLVLGNFVSTTNQLISQQYKNQTINLDIKNKERFIIKYFGSIDKKMNASAITAFASCISKYPSVDFLIYTNSGLWGELKDIVDKTENIMVKTSGLSEDDYIKEMAQSDFLLLPYNTDKWSTSFLGHSFSNKLVDYIESGSEILAFGPKTIPTLNFCFTKKLGTYLSCNKELLQFFENLCNGDKKRNTNLINDEVSEFIELGKSSVSKFMLDIEEVHLDMPSELKNLASAKLLCEKNKAIHLGFLIKRKILDNKTGQQSLSASIAGNILKKYGYSGFDYEI
jgi:hypothetical protein